MRPIQAWLQATCVATLLTAPVASGQSHIWSQRFGNTEADAGSAIATDAAGNVHLAGSFSGTVSLGAAPIASEGATDVFLASYDPGGAHTWSRGFGGGGADAAGGVAIASNGDVVLTGSFADTVDFGGGSLASAGGADIFVARFDASGAHIWSLSFGSTGVDAALGCAVDTTGNVLVSGHFEETVDFGGGPLVSAGSRDIFALKLDPTGAHVWSKRFGGEIGDMGDAIGTDTSGNVFLTGSFFGEVDFGGGTFTSTGADGFVAMYDPGGVHLWSRSFGANSGDFGQALAVDLGGNVVVTGYFIGTMDLGGGPLSSGFSSEIFLVKYASDGTHLWSASYGDANLAADFGIGVATNAVGGVSLTGSFGDVVDFGGGQLTSAGGADVFLATFDANGVHQWSRAFGDKDFDQGAAVAVDPAGDVVMTGGFRGAVDFGGGTLFSLGDVDVILAKYEAALVFVSEEPAPPPVSLHRSRPNPFGVATAIRFDVPAPAWFTLEIFDVNGRRVHTLVDGHVRAGRNHVVWNGTDERGTRVASGSYVYRLRGPGVDRTERVVVVR